MPTPVAAGLTPASSTASCASPPAGPARAAASRRRAHVRSTRTIANDIVEVVLQPERGGWLPAEAGAHVRLHLPDGIERSYSLCPHEGASDHYVLAVKREPSSRGGSMAVHALRVDDAIEIEGPYSAFRIDPSEARLLMIAGGIGITPIYAMAEEAARRGVPFELHYFIRGRGDAAYVSSLEHAAYASRVFIHEALTPQAVDEVLCELAGRSAEGDGVYVCGPQPLIALTRERFEPRLGEARVHWESFGSTQPAAPALASEPERPFELELASGEGSFTVPPGRSALQVLLDAGVDVPFSCREGECGMCVVDVVEGVPEHRDRFLSDEVKAGGDCMALCVSRSKTSRIVVDF